MVGDAGLFIAGAPKLNKDISYDIKRCEKVQSKSPNKDLAVQEVALFDEKEQHHVRVANTLLQDRDTIRAKKETQSRDQSPGVRGAAPISGGRAKTSQLNTRKNKRGQQEAQKELLANNYRMT